MTRSTGLGCRDRRRPASSVSPAPSSWGDGGHKVVLIEREQPGQQASRVAAGLLGTSALCRSAMMTPSVPVEARQPAPVSSEFIAKVESIGRRSAGLSHGRHALGSQRRPKRMRS